LPRRPRGSSVTETALPRCETGPWLTVEPRHLFYTTVRTGTGQGPETAQRDREGNGARSAMQNSSLLMFRDCLCATAVWDTPWVQAAVKGGHPPAQWTFAGCVVNTSELPHTRWPFARRPDWMRFGSAARDDTDDGCRCGEIERVVDTCGRAATGLLIDRSLPARR
jgi:hypothetical protein